MVEFARYGLRKIKIEQFSDVNEVNLKETFFASIQVYSAWIF